MATTKRKPMKRSATISKNADKRSQKDLGPRDPTKVRGGGSPVAPGYQTPTIPKSKWIIPCI